MDVNMITDKKYSEFIIISQGIFLKNINDINKGGYFYCLPPNWDVCI